MDINDDGPGRDALSLSTAPAFEALDPDVLAVHRDLVAQTRALPAAIAQLGFLEEDLGLLSIAGHPNGDASYAVTDELGRVVAIKRRLAEMVGVTHEAYEAPSFDDERAPSWVSPGAMKARDVLVVDGELNGMMVWLARPELAVVGAPGYLGWLPPALLETKTVFILARDDEEGEYVRLLWSLVATEAGAAHVEQLETLEDGEPVHIAGHLGREKLRANLP